MKKLIILTSLLTVSLFAFDGYVNTSNYSNGNFQLKQNHHHNNNSNRNNLKNKLKEIKEMYKLQENFQLKQLNLRQKVLETKIKMLKEKIKTLTTTPAKAAQDSVITYTIDPKIIVKTINYKAIRRKPIYIGLLMYYESEKMLNVGKQTTTNPAKIFFSSPTKSAR